MSSDRLQIVAPDPRLHFEQICDLVAKVFADGGYYRHRDLRRVTHAGDSPYDWQASRIGLLGDRVVTHYGVWDYQMRIGTARVRTGGIGSVATDGDYRKRGWMNRTAQDAMEAMRDLGYDMSLLFGIPDFYQRFGYARAWADTKFFVQVGDLPKEKLALPLSKRKGPFHQDLVALYNRCYAGTTGTAVRPTHRRGYLWERSLSFYVWPGKSGVAAGYVIAEPDGARAVCKEYCGDAETALRAVATLARRWGCREVEFQTIPYDSGLARRVRRGSCRVETHFARSGDAMICLVNLPAAVAKLTGELSRRLQASSLARWRGLLTLANSRDRVTLSVRNGQVSLARERQTRHLIRGGNEVAQLLIGGDEPDEIAEAAGMELRGDAARLLEVLFPAQRPQLSTIDEYFG